MGKSGWGWNASFTVHSRTVVRPGGSVRRKMPKLIERYEQGLHKGKKPQTYFGFELGAQTTANDSGSIR